MAEQRKPLLRREKSKPCEDFWHTIRLGAVVCLLIFITISAMGANL